MSKENKELVRRMRRRAALSVVAAALGASNGAALAAGSPPSPKASCVATITSFEATQLEPGAIGAEVSGLATSGAEVGDLVTDLAHAHGGSLAACAGAEG